MAILNLTQHAATAEQRGSFIFDVPAADRASLARKLTFSADELLTGGRDFMRLRAHGIITEFVRPRQIIECRLTLRNGEDEADDRRILEIIDNAKRIDVMIGGLPGFMPILESALIACGARVGYAVSERRLTETTGDDGIVRKTNEFVHCGMVWAN